MAHIDKLLLVLRVTFCLLAGGLSGIFLSFNVYAITLKGTFNFTQTQVEIAASANGIGSGMGLVEIFLTGVFGYTTTFFVAWVTLPLSCGLLSLAAVYSDFFHQWPVLVYIFQLCLGSGTAIVLIVVVRLPLEIISKEYMATFLGAFGATQFFWKILYAAILETFFPRNLAGFFLCVSAMSAVILGICFLLLHPVAMELSCKAEGGRDNNGAEINKDWKFQEIIQLPSFHMMFWSTALFAGSSYPLLNNITSVTDSIGIKDSFTTVTIMSVSIMTTRFSYGLIFDRAGSLTCGFLLLLSGYLSTGVGVCIGMFFLTTTTVHILTVLSGIGVGIGFHFPLTVLIFQYGGSNYSYLCSTLGPVSNTLVTLNQVLMGFLYDKKRVELGIESNDCLGPDCFFWAFFVQLILITIVIITQSVNFYCSRKCKI